MAAKLFSKPMVDLCYNAGSNETGRADAANVETALNIQPEMEAEMSAKNDTTTSPRTASTDYINDQKILAVSATTDRELIDIFLSTKPSEKTQLLYRYTVDQFMNFVGKDLRNIRLEDVVSYGKSLESNRPATRAQRISTIKSLLSFAQKVGYVPLNVAAVISAPKPKDTLSERILTEEQVLKIIMAADGNERHELLIRLLYRTGGRISEILGVTWKDLVKRDEAAQVALFGKNQNTRYVLIPIELYDSLMALKGDTPDTERLFKMTRQGAWRIVKVLAKKAKLGVSPSPHWFRHAHATHAMEHGATIKLVSQTLDHSSVAITSKYLHVRPDESSGTFLKIG